MKRSEKVLHIRLFSTFRQTVKTLYRWIHTRDTFAVLVQTHVTMHATVLKYGTCTCSKRICSKVHIHHQTPNLASTLHMSLHGESACPQIMANK